MNESIITHRYAAATTWGAWILSNIPQVNEVLQTVVLALAIFSSIIAFWKLRK